MKVSDFIFQFNSRIGLTGQGMCRVRIFAIEGECVAAVLTDITSVGSGSVGPSVTNSVEYIFEALVAKGLVPERVLIIEHYEDISWRGATFDVVSFSKNNSPSWESIGVVDVCSRLKCDESEFDDVTSKNPRLISEIDRMKNSIDPFLGAPFPESPDIVNRRSEIEARMLGKQVLVQAVESGAGESELHRLLESDLSIFGEVYASPHEEYMCFTEFPVGDGFVDFAIFTGRSRMDVILIEIKGADFNLIVAGSYRNFSSKVNEAIQQIRTRIGVVYRDMESFRRDVHKIRQRIEAGGSLYGSFVGPHPRLEVDQNKDINIRSVVIAGRTRDDFEESRQRHDFEWSVKPPVKVETWDTFLRKLRRS